MVTQRDKNRVKEHSKEGHKLEEDTAVSSWRQPDNKFYRCLCGWVGWIHKDMEVANA